MLAKVNSSAVVRLEAVLVEVEVDIASQGLPAFNIVGLPDKAVEEAKERIRSAIKNTGADFSPKRITVNLAPADLSKEGPSYDLPIALGILLAPEQITSDIKDAFFLGGLSLDGRLRHTNGVLPQTILAYEKDLKIESSSIIRKRVQKARDLQTKRFKNCSKKYITSNAKMSSHDVKKFCELSTECINLLRQADLSAHSYYRTLKLTRTIADLENSKHIKPVHIDESLQFRPKQSNA